MNRYEQAESFIINKLTKELDPILTYHGLHHILDVTQAAEMIGINEKIDSSELELLKIAALFHDSGFTVSPTNHEIISCEIAKNSLPLFGYSVQELEIIYGMILATKYPTQPKNKLEEIICDADLDYLGRDDFFMIGETLYDELINFNIIHSKEEWNNLQERFLESHRFYTNTSILLRNEKKLEHLNSIKEINHH